MWFDLPPGQWAEFVAHPRQKAEAFVLDPSSGKKYECVASGTVEEYCTRVFEAVAEQIGVDKMELYARWEKIKQEGWTTFSHEGDAEPRYPGTELVEGPRCDHLVDAAASFKMNDRGGLHTRPAVLLYKALKDLDFDHVVARHEGNGRVARMSCGQKTTPAFWILLLRLEARRDEFVRFTIWADTQRQAEAALEAIASVLGRSKPGRYDYWRELGLDGWCEIYLEDWASPENGDMCKHYRLMGKSFQDKRPEPSPGTPMSERVD
jgi:phosphotransferase system HPr-like phosphotransfer protein